MSYKIEMTKEAVKDYEKVKKSKFAGIVRNLLEILEKDPFAYPPPYEKLKGDFSGHYSRRINIQHRLVYMVQGDKIIIKSMWEHYK